ncbi:MAG: S41 family peptidase [Alistipes sp.]|nr:S41 family peptidase [Rikenellaceae bacterium]MBO5188748.1 S41 family peptidase [Alistipes sp.]MBQ2727618.1 S41 family peptidase [Alistipes sp.]
MTALLLVAVCLSFLYGHRNDFGLGRNMELAVNMMRELTVSYVDSIDTDKLMAGAAAGMVRDLDPYTEFIPEKEMSTFEALTTGKYGGVGALIRQKKDYVIIAQPYEGSPSDRAGLKIGDKILAIGGEDAKGFTTEQVSSRLKGDPGSSVVVKVEQLDGTVREVTITRERIAIPGVPYAGWVAEGIGFVRHSDFTEGCYQELRNAIERLRKEGELQGLILDYRSNGGGFLQEAIKILGLFTERDTEVVRTKGRNENRSYRTSTDPVYKDIPLVVLINGSSASAAEIVSGSLQDLDRAVLIGQRTFGKGLVQTTVPIGYNSMLKLTTAKYYIPSGRCIQAIDYSHSQQGSVRIIPDSLIREYTTRAGRKVYDGGGIMPDIRLEPEYISRFAATLYGLGFIEDFGDDYIRRKGYQPIDLDNFTITEQDFADFKAFMKEKEVPYESETRSALKHIKEAAKNDRFKAMEAHIEELESRLKDDTETNIETYRKEIEESITSDLVLRHAYTAGVIRNSLREDREVKRAIEVLRDTTEYRRILREQNTVRK